MANGSSIPGRPAASSSRKGRAPAHNARWSGRLGKQQMAPHAPEFSFVATSRNDDHGGDVLRRTQSFVERLAEQCERHRGAAELVLVEWNPPPSRAGLIEVLGWPAGTEWFSGRRSSVPRQMQLARP